MTNPWFRMYGDVINDPKVMGLPEAMRWHWVAMLCVASKTDGILPPAADLAFMLRLKLQQAAAIVTELHAGGLLDKIEGGFAPHNWNGRQYKSDVSTDRVKRFRNAKRNVSSDVSETPPEQIQITDTETEKKDAEAKASGAGAPIDVRSRLFSGGLETLARLTGKGPDACRSFVGKCLKAASDDAVTVLGLIEDAERNRVVDASAWIAARLKEPRPVAAQKITIDEAITQFARIGSWSRHAPVSDVSQAPAELLAKHGLLPDGRKMAMEKSN